jgi:hypothetical protein
MKHIRANDAIILMPGQAISIKADAAYTMRIDCGMVWMTIAGNPDDHWLASGERVALIAGRHIVIEAGPVFSRIDFLPPAVAPVRQTTNVHATPPPRASIA